ncbi:MULTISPECIES: winged helix-turn-helix transcriptional regulator [Gemella]|uniref:winged helix-turn-helix transcriptional regulator n=1 Tax=Gemella TaxID=1378 RepID=UPI000767E75E|nr:MULTISPECIES: helix-turn-helix domain-containing protein [Gemella]AME09541.1 HxlR family transcriptional regulator [Gemella sp. oral taxon 928]AXI27179.1 transcriptional regulator [Gemella sp. ND 6198]
MKNETLFGICPFFTTQKILAGKWTILILHILSNKEKRFNELQRELGEITQATLTKQLKQLEHDGLIHREVYAQVPPKVEYSLTSIGKNFQKVLDELENWGADYIEYLKTTAQKS